MLDDDRCVARLSLLGKGLCRVQVPRRCNEGQN